MWWLKRRFQRNGRVHLNPWGKQYRRILAVEVCASAVVMVVMLEKPCSELVLRVLATHSDYQFPLHFASCASPCDITFQLDSTSSNSSASSDFEYSAWFWGSISKGPNWIKQTTVTDNTSQVWSLKLLHRESNAVETLLVKNEEIYQYQRVKRTFLKIASESMQYLRVRRW